MIFLLETRLEIVSDTLCCNSRCYYCCYWLTYTDDGQGGRRRCGRATDKVGRDYLQFIRAAFVREPKNELL